MQEKYAHGGEIYGKNIRLDYSINVNPFRMPERVKQAIRAGLDEDYRYPDDRCTGLREAVAESLGRGISPDWVFCGNGAADVIYRYALAVKPLKVLVLAPTFSEYEKAFTLAGAGICYYELKKEDNFTVREDILKAIAGVDVAVLCNPNNPAGNLIDRELMLRILAEADRQNTRILVDECFMEFTGCGERDSVLSLLQDYEKLLVLKAFTKTYAMAGIRLGYGISKEDGLQERLRRAGAPWSVSSIAQRAGIAALKETEYVRQTAELVGRERRFLAEGLAKLGLWVCPSRTNYLMFTAGRNLYERLMEKGILIRQCGNYHGLGEEYYRICVGLHEENVLLLEAIEKLLEDK